ncbi:hypothetical protein SynPROS71_01878 [Synechococcus sp. PROS-7-1]|nr:hypothetical protein SynPROS71_01878 [Synechococcus sp. PROS-7-1]
MAEWTPAQADSTQATCWLSRHDHTIPVETGPFRFSQRQGNVDVRFTIGPSISRTQNRERPTSA